MRPSMAMENHVAPGIDSLLDLVEEPHEGFLPRGFVAHVKEDWFLAQDLAANLIDPGDESVLARHDQRAHMECLEEALSDVVLPATPEVRSPNMDARRWLLKEPLVPSLPIALTGREMKPQLDKGAGIDG